MNASSRNLSTSTTATTATAHQAQQLRQLNKIFFAILYYESLLYSPIGILLNALALAVFSRKAFRSGERGLAPVAFCFQVFSATNIVTFVVLFMYYFLMSVGNNPALWADFWCPFWNFAVRVVMQFSSWTQALIAVYRLMSVARRTASRQRMKIGIVLVACFTFICAVNGMNWHWQLRGGGGGGSHGVISRAVRVCESTLGSLAWMRDLVSVLVKSVVPFVVMLTTNVVLARKLALSRQSELKKLSQHDQELIKVIIIVNSVFLVSNVLTVISVVRIVFLYLVPNMTPYEVTLISVISQVPVYMFFTDDLLAFFVYVKFNEKFRREFLLMMRDHVPCFEQLVTIKRRVTLTNVVAVERTAMAAAGTSASFLAREAAAPTTSLVNLTRQQSIKALDINAW